MNGIEKLTMIHKLHDVIMEVMNANNVDMSKIPATEKLRLRSIGQNLIDQTETVIENYLKNEEKQTNESQTERKN